MNPRLHSPAGGYWPDPENLDEQNIKFSLSLFGDRIAKVVNEKQLLGEILENLRQATGATLGVLLMIEEERQQFDTCEAQGFSLPAAAMKNLTWSLRRHKQIRRHQMDKAFSLSQEELRHRPDFSFERAMGFYSLCYQPLGRDGQILGAVLLGNREGGIDFTPEDIKRLAAAAIIAGTEMERIWLYRELQGMALNVIHALVTTLEAKDCYTCGHSERVAEYAVKTGALLGWSKEQLDTLRLSATLHDIGKIGVPETILHKPAQLTAEEYAVIKRHPENGARILRKVPQLQPVMSGVLCHHERFDGRGYPQGLKGKDIPAQGRIIAVADAYDAMTGERPYRGRMKHADAVEEVMKNIGTQFDPKMVEAFLEAFRIGTLV